MFFAGSTPTTTGVLFFCISVFLRFTSSEVQRGSSFACYDVGEFHVLALYSVFSIPMP